MAQAKTILIVDDDLGVREFLAELLRRNGWSVLTANDGDLGIELAKTRRPSVILCDLLMPRCNGFQVCQAVRRDESLRATRLIVASGRDYQSDRQAARAAGADEYVSKPIRPANLLQLLATQMEQLPAPDPGQALAAPAAAAPPADLGTRVKFWGVRGSVPTPGPDTVRYGGNTSCVEVRAAGQIIILDAGTGLRPLGRALASEFAQAPLSATLLLTHTHWDHIQGLPFFQPVYQPRNHLRILGYEGARHGLGTVLSSQMDSAYFPIGLGEVPANIQIEELKELEFNVGSVRVQAHYANHPGICVGYRLFTPHGSIAYFPDNEPYYGQRQASSDSGADTRVLDFARAQDERMVAFLRGADVLIIDSQYDGSEYPQHVGWGHGCLDEVVSLALRSEVKRLFLFHHDPDHDDAKIDQMAAYARGLVSASGQNMKVEAAREGFALELR